MSVLHRRPRLDAVTPSASLIVPAIVAAAVLSFSCTLLVIGARSPYTHANLFPAYNATYARTAQILVGPGQPYAGIGGDAQAADPVGSGARLFVTKSCATCHGLDARGGTFAPPIAGSSAAAVTKRVRSGPGGMPRYDPAGLSDDEISAIAAYLRSLAVQK